MNTQEDVGMYAICVYLHFQYEVRRDRDDRNEYQAQPKYGGRVQDYVHSRHDVANGNCRPE